MAALPKARIPRSKAEVERWAATLQAGALNDDARQLVGAAARHFEAMFDAIEAARAAEQELLEATKAHADSPGEDTKTRLKVAALRYRATPGEVEAQARLGPLIERMIGRAQAANHAEADAAIVQLRQFAEARERLLEGFGPSHKTTPGPARAPRRQAAETKRQGKKGRK
ncbi:MAG: hypothetical protein KC501_25000 [Myxococcales bacterium]|nr:hypothetical protein [Myxococcales bacterium]